MGIYGQQIYLKLLLVCLLETRYGDGAGNTTEENSSIFFLIQCASCRQQGHVGSKTLLQQSPPLNWGCWLRHIVLYNGSETIIVVIVHST